MSTSILDTHGNDLQLNSEHLSSLLQSSSSHPHRPTQYQHHQQQHQQLSHLHHYQHSAPSPLNLSPFAMPFAPHAYPVSPAPLSLQHTRANDHHFASSSSSTQPVTSSSSSIFSNNINNIQTRPHRLNNHPTSNSPPPHHNDMSYVHETQIASNNNPSPSPSPSPNSNHNRHHNHNANSMNANNNFNQEQVLFHYQQQQVMSTPNIAEEKTKTELCSSWTNTSTCRYGSRCKFAHGLQELRPVARHPLFKSQMCRNYALHGRCPYAQRCRFVHNISTADRDEIRSMSEEELMDLKNRQTAMNDDYFNQNASSISSSPTFSPHIQDHSQHVSPIFNHSNTVPSNHQAIPYNTHSQSSPSPSIQRSPNRAQHAIGEKVPHSPYIQTASNMQANANHFTSIHPSSSPSTISTSPIQQSSLWRVASSDNYPSDWHTSHSSSNISVQTPLSASSLPPVHPASALHSLHSNSSNNWQQKQPPILKLSEANVGRGTILQTPSPNSAPAVANNSATFISHSSTPSLSPVMYSSPATASTTGTMSVTESPHHMLRIVNDEDESFLNNMPSLNSATDYASGCAITNANSNVAQRGRSLIRHRQQQQMQTMPPSAQAAHFSQVQLPPQQQISQLTALGSLISHKQSLNAAEVDSLAADDSRAIRINAAQQFSLFSSHQPLKSRQQISTMISYSTATQQSVLEDESPHSAFSSRAHRLSHELMEEEEDDDDDDSHTVHNYQSNFVSLSDSVKNTRQSSAMSENAGLESSHSPANGPKLQSSSSVPASPSLSSWLSPLTIIDDTISSTSKTIIKNVN